MQLSIFNIADKNEFTNIVDNSKQSTYISGLQYIENFISDEEHLEILKYVNNSPWLNDLKRRVQHYGYKYDYKKRTLDYSMYLGELPEWLNNIANKIVDSGYMKCLPDQVIVNEYKPGQGISDHIDCEPCFEETIISLSLGSSCIMEFKNKTNKSEKYEIFLKPNSLVVISGESRYHWMHGIPSREKDKWQEKVIPRATRISLTFRKVIIM